MNNVSAEDAVMNDFHLLMMIECNACCIYRELNGLSVGDLAQCMGVSDSTLNKLEFGNVGDGHELKNEYMRQLGLGLPFVTRLNSDAVEYFFYHMRQLLDERIFNIAVEKIKIDDKKLLTKCTNCRNEAMRIVLLIANAAHYNLNIDYLIKRVFNPARRHAEKESQACHKLFVQCINNSRDEESALNREQQYMIWETLENHFFCLKKSQKEVLKLLKS